jgi:hypothetical protein
VPTGIGTPLLSRGISSQGWSDWVIRPVLLSNAPVAHLPFRSLVILAVPTSNSFPCEARAAAGGADECCAPIVTATAAPAVKRTRTPMLTTIARRSRFGAEATGFAGAGFEAPAEAKAAGRDEREACTIVAIRRNFRREHRAHPVKFFRSS